MMGFFIFRIKPMKFGVKITLEAVPAKAQIFRDEGTLRLPSLWKDGFDSI